MLLLDSQQLERLEQVLQEVNEISSDPSFDYIAPSEFWTKVEAPVNILEELVKSLKEAMLVMKPEKHYAIEHLYEEVVEPLTVFKETLFKETTDSSSNSQLALEQLRKATVGGFTFLELAKEIHDSPSPTMIEILRLKEIYETKKYLASVEAPQTLRVRLKTLLKRIEALHASITNIEKTLGGIKEELQDVEEVSLKFLSRPVDAMRKDKEEVPISESNN